MALSTVGLEKHRSPDFATALEKAKKAARAEAGRERATSQYHQNPTFENALAVLVATRPQWAWAQKRKKKKSQRFPTSVSSMSLRQLAQRAGLQV